MNQELSKIRSFTDLIAWKEAHKLVIEIYGNTSQFPKEEVFGLVMQSRRCAVSITSNIAEGFSRNSFKEKIQFYGISHGSLSELQNQILIAKDVGFLSKGKFDILAQQTVRVSKLLNGLMKASKKKT